MSRARRNPIGLPAPLGAQVVRVGSGEHTHVYNGKGGVLCNSGKGAGRVGKYGDGWLASQVSDADFAKRAMDVIREAAVSAGRDPNAIGWQSMIAPPPRPGDDKGKTFYAEPDRVAARAADLKKMGFDAVALNATAIFQSGARSVEAILDALQVLHDRIRTEVG